MSQSNTQTFSPGRWLSIGAGLLITFAAGGLLSGCQGHRSTDTDDIVSGGGTGALNAASVVAVVNNQKITSGQFYDALQHYVPAQMPGFPQNPMLGQPAGRVALQDLIVNTLTVQLAAQNGVPVQDSELQASYEDNKMLQQANVTASFDSILQSQGYSVAEYEQDILAPSTAQTNLLSKTVTITPAELQSSYKANEKLYTIPASVHIRRIACATKQAADTVYAGLKSGQPMSNFLTNNIASDDAGGNAADPTDIAHWINVEQPTPGLEGVSKAMKNAKAGDILPPIQIQGQWWVMQVVQTRPRELIPFNQVQDLVRINLIRQRAGQQGMEMLQNALMQYMQKAKIQIVPVEYSGLAAQINDTGVPAPGSAVQSAAPPAPPGPPAPPAPGSGKQH